MTPHEHISQEACGRCDFIDVLEEAAVRHTPVDVLCQGRVKFTDVVRDVVTQNQHESVVFERNGTIPLDDIVDVTRADLPPDHPRAVDLPPP